MQAVIKAAIVTSITILIIAAVLLFVAPGRLAKKIINDYSENLIGLKMKCESVHIAPLLGKGYIGKLTIYNVDAKDMYSDYLLKAQNVRLKINIKDYAVKLGIKLHHPTIHYQFSSTGTNFSKAIAAVKQKTQNTKPATTSKNKKAANNSVTNDIEKHQLTIDTLDIYNAKILISAKVGSHDIGDSIVIPDIHIRDLGSSDQKTNVDNLADMAITILQTINKNLIAANAQRIGNGAVDTLKKLESLKPWKKQN